MEDLPSVSAGENGPRKTLQAIKYRRGSLEILDQRVLPHETKYVTIDDAERTFDIFISFHLHFDRNYS